MIAKPARALVSLVFVLLAVGCGRRPEGDFKRVRVLLRHGGEPAYSDALTPTAPPGWAVDTTRWSLLGDPYDVAWFLPL